MGIDAQIGTHRHFAPVDHHRRLADPGGGAWRRGREQHVDVAEQRGRFLHYPAADPADLIREPGGQQHAGQQPVAHRRIVIHRARLQPLGMQAPARHAGEAEGCRARRFRAVEQHRPRVEGGRRRFNRR